MKILIVEDDPVLRGLLAELVGREIPGAEIVAADNLDDAVTALHGSSGTGNREPGIGGILSDGIFPAWPAEMLISQWNAPKPNWVGLAGWAAKLHIPLVVLTGDEVVAAQARAVGVPAFMKPMQVHDAIACLRALVIPKALRENPAVTDQNHENERSEPWGD